MQLSGLTHSEIVSALKQYFTDEELDEVSARLDRLIGESDTLDDLITEINDELIEGNDFADPL
jgi:hypothetical protein